MSSYMRGLCTASVWIRFVLDSPACHCDVQGIKTMFILGGHSMGIKFIKSVELLMFFVLVFLVSCSCDKSPTDGGNNHYDQRNVSRNEGKSLAPSLTVDDIGNVHLVWADSTPGNYEILYSMKGLGGDWSEPVNISNTSGNSSCSRIAVDPSSNLHVVWAEVLSIDSSIVDIFYSMKTLGGSWSTAINLSNTSPYHGADLPDIGVDASGNVHVVWWELTAMYRIKDANDIWSPVESVPVYGCNLAMAVEGNGTVHVVAEAGGYLQDIWYSMKSLCASWTEPVNISESSYYSWCADVATDDEGSVYVVWTEEQKGMVYLSVKSLLGSWTKSDSIANTRGRPWVSHLVVGSDKSLHLVWSERVSLSEIRYLKRDTDGVWSDVINVSETSRNSLCASIALDASGNLHIAWQDKTPGNWDIFYTIIQTR